MKLKEVFLLASDITLLVIIGPLYYASRLIGWTRNAISARLRDKGSMT